MAAASSAQAETPRFKAGGYPADVQAEADPAGATQTLSFALGDITCGEVSAQASMEAEAATLNLTKI